MPSLNIHQLATRGNNALNTNPPSGTDISLTQHGSDWYWALFCLMCLFAIVFVTASLKAGHRQRLFYYLGAAASLFMAVMYFSLASDLGFTGIQTQYSHYRDGGIRQIFYARYIGWFLAGPLVILCMTYFCGLSWALSLFLVGLQETFVVCLLIGSLVRSSYKWGYFVFGTAAFLLAATYLLFVGRRSAQRIASGGHTPYLLGTSSIIFLWMLYPVCWGLSEGGNVISPTSEGVFYGVLDLLVMGSLMYLVFTAHKLGLPNTNHGDDMGAISREKNVRNDSYSPNINSMETARGDDGNAGYYDTAADSSNRGMGRGASATVAGMGAGVAATTVDGMRQPAPRQSYSRDYAYDENRATSDGHDDLRAVPDTANQTTRRQQQRDGNSSASQGRALNVGNIGNTGNASSKTPKAGNSGDNAPATAQVVPAVVTRTTRYTAQSDNTAETMAAPQPRREGKPVMTTAGRILNADGTTNDAANRI